jgi:ABC-2 type transport system permease protein
MPRDDLRGIYYIMLKDLRAYYLKPPNVSWGILFPFAFVLAFAIRDPGEMRDMIPGLLALTLLFSTSSMEAIVITFERRIGALERLMLAPIRLPALLAGKLLGGMVFGLMITLVVLIVVMLVYETGPINWLVLTLTMLLSAAAFSALGALISVSVEEVFEAQTLANMFRFPMMFLSGIFLPIASLPQGLQIVARVLPLTYAVEALRVALVGEPIGTAVLDIGMLAAFTAACFVLAVRILTRRIA